MIAHEFGGHWGVVPIEGGASIFVRETEGDDAGWIAYFPFEHDQLTTLINHIITNGALNPKERQMIREHLDNLDEQ